MALQNFHAVGLWVDGELNLLGEVSPLEEAIELF